MLVRPPLRACGDVAGLPHERIDGSGYHRGLPAAALPLSARLLIAAEVFQAMREDRSWRPRLDAKDASDQLMREVSSGRLDRRAADAVLAAAGQRSKTDRTTRKWPAGLTDREVEELQVLARGFSNKQIDTSLHTSPATVHTPVITLYGNIAVNTRTAATQFSP